MGDYSITINLMMAGLDKIGQLRRALQGLNQDAQGAQKVSQATQAISASTEKAARNTEAYASAQKEAITTQKKAADESLRHSQALARLLLAQGKSAEAIKVLERALKDFQGTEIQAIRAQIQLTNLQNDYANSPLIGAVRGQTSALKQFQDQASAAAEATGDAAAAANAGAEATLAYAQTLAQVQQIQGDAAGAARTLQEALVLVQQRQAEVLAQQNSTSGRFLSLLHSAALLVNALATGLQLYQGIQPIVEKTSRDTDRAAQGVGRGMAAAKSAVDALGTAFDVARAKAENLGRRMAALFGSGAGPRSERAARAGQAAEAVASDLLSKIRDANQKIVDASRSDEAEKAKRQAAELAAKARDAAKYFEFLDKAKKKAFSFLREEQGSFSLIEFLDGLAVAAARVNQYFRQLGAGISRALGSGISASVRTVFGETAGALVNAERATKGVEASFAALNSETGRTVIGLGGLGLVLGSLVVAVGTLAAGIAAAVPVLVGLGLAGLRANSQLEQTRIGIASVIASVATLKDSQGVELKGINELNAALPFASQQLEKLRIDALETSLTFEQLSKGFLEAVGPGISAGLNLDEIRKTVVDLSQVIVPLTGNAEQLGQELRAIFSGDISADSQVAMAILGKNARELVKEAKEQNRLAEFLRERLLAASAAGRLMAQTFEAAKTNLAEAGTTLAANVTRGLFDRLRQDINRILPQIFTTAAGRLEIAPAFKGISDTLTEVFNTVGDRLSDFIEYAAEQTQRLSAFLQENKRDVMGLIDAFDLLIGVMGKFADTIGQILASNLGKWFGGISGWLKGVGLELAFVTDLIELLWATFVGGLKSAELGILGPLKKALDFFGIQLDWLDNKVQSLLNDLGQIGPRLEEGFKNLREARNRIEAQQAFDKLSDEDKARAAIFLGEDFKLPGAAPDFTRANKGTATIVPPRSASDPNKGGRRSTGESELISSRERLNAALVSLQKKYSEIAIGIVRDELSIENEILDRQLEDRQISLETYYAEKAKLIKQSTEAEAEAIKKQMDAERASLAEINKREAERVALAEKNFARAKKNDTVAAERKANEIEKARNEAATDRAQTTEKLLGLEFKLNQVIAKGAADEEDNARRRSKALKEFAGQLDGIARRFSEATGRGFTEEIEQLISNLEARRQTIETGLATTIQRIQNLVERGQASEIGARERILQLQKEARTQIEATVRGLIALSKLLPLGDNTRNQIQARIADLKKQLEDLKSLGVDPIFGQIRQGLENDLSGAFFDFLTSAEGGIEALRKLALDWVNSFRKALAKLLTDTVEKKIIQPLVGKFFETVLGVAQVDPATVQNTAAIELNTKSTDALTQAMLSFLSGAGGGSNAAGLGNFQVMLPSDLGGQAGEQQVGQLDGFFNKVKRSFTRFTGSLGSIATGLSGGLRSVLSALLNFAGAVLGMFGGGGASGFAGAKAGAGVSFDSGGFTGWMSPREPAGIVHGREFVFSAPAVKNLGIGYLNSLHEAAAQGGYMDGGLVGALPIAERPSMSGSSAPINLRLINQIGDDDIIGALDSPSGERMLLNRMSRSQAKYRAALGI